jgi:hypothetical protein
MHSATKEATPQISKNIWLVQKSPQTSWAILILSWEDQHVVLCIISCSCFYTTCSITHVIDFKKQHFVLRITSCSCSLDSSPLCILHVSSDMNAGPASKSTRFVQIYLKGKPRTPSLKRANTVHVTRELCTPFMCTRCCEHTLLCAHPNMCQCAFTLWSRALVIAFTYARP